MRFQRLCHLLLLPALLAAGALRAQATVPAVSAPIAPQSLLPGGAAATVDLRNHFALPGVSGTIVQIDMVLGKFNVELFADAPATRANFLNYVTRGSYQNTIIHRSVPGFVIQGGGYTYSVSTTHIPVDPPVVNEFGRSNLRGNLAMAKNDGNPNSATSEWFVNLADNSANLDQQNGGFTVFARVLGTGMDVVDAVAALPRANVTFSANLTLQDVPIRNFATGQTQLVLENLVAVTSLAVVSVHPVAGLGNAVLTYSVTNTAPAIVTAALTGSTLTLTPLATGTASVTVRATDTNGNAAETAFAVSVSAAPPVFTAQPVSQTIAAGTTAALRVTATGATTFQWRRNGVALPGANGATLLVANMSAADAGDYTCVATNAAGTTTSAAATLTVANVAATTVGRLINLSILTTAGSGAKALTMGATVGGNGTTGALPLVLRAIGPGLEQFGVPLETILADPTMVFNAAGNATPLATNDDWGGGTALATAFTGVGAFELPAVSRDSALLQAAEVPLGLATAGYTVTVTGKGAASGTALAEIYDAAGDTRTAATPRLINLSTLTAIDAGGELAVGFVLRGDTARTLLVRGVGPTLAATFGIEGVMTDPKLELYDLDHGSVQIAANDNWAGDPALEAAFNSVGAFAFASSATTDAALVITLPPGRYSALVRGADGGGGTAIVEVYEIP